MPDHISGPTWPGLLKRTNLYLRLIYTLRGLNHLVKTLAQELGLTPENPVWPAYQNIVQELDDLEAQVKDELAKPNEKVTPSDLDRISQEIDQLFQEFMAEGEDTDPAPVAQTAGKEEGRP